MAIAVGNKVRIKFGGRVKKKDGKKLLDEWIEYKSGDVGKVVKIRARRRTKVYSVKLSEGAVIDVRGQHLEPANPKKRKVFLK